jgi:glycyl-radical enzyme activating protein family
MSDGLVFNIQRFSIHDGPGIRTSVFMKGCPLRCIWCHNPESRSGEPEISYISHKCAGCGRCAAVCPNGAHIITADPQTSGDGKGFIHIFDRTKCVRCGKCVSACFYSALSVAGKRYSSEEVIAEVIRDLPFYKNSGGGVTFTGGEPFAQYEFLLDMLRRSKENGLHVCIETSLFAPTERLLEAAEYVDLFLTDYKESNNALHREYTGVPIEPILVNLHALDASGAKIALRCPLIPGKNDREDHYRAIAELANSLTNLIEIDLEPYHPLGISKCDNFGLECAYNRSEFMEKSSAAAAAEFIRKFTEKKVVIQ